MLHEFKFAFRSLWKSPGFTLVATLTIAVGIGANTALFSVFNRLVLNPLSLPDSSRLVRVWTNDASRNFQAPAISYPRYEEIRDQATSFTQVGASAFTGFAFTREGGDPEQLNALRVNRAFLPALGIEPLRGRNFTPEEDQAGGPAVALVSHEFWRTRFGGSEGLLNSTIVLNGVPHVVVGILPPRLGNPFDPFLVFTPRVFDNVGLRPDSIRNGAMYLQVTARLKDGVSLAKADAELKSIARTSREAFPTRLDAHSETEIRFFRDELAGNLRPTFYLLSAAVLFVLLIACANVASLFLSRLSARHKEIAIRRSLGATRGQIVRGFLAESLLFSLLAGTLGVIFSLWAVSAVHRLANGFFNTPLTSAGFDAPTLLFTVGLSALSSLLVGFVPALQSSRGDIADVLKDTSRTAGGGVRGTRFRSWLIMGEVALSVVLLIGASLLLRSFLQLQRSDPGFRPHRLATAFVAIPAERYATPAQQNAFFEEVVSRLKAHPQIEAAAAAVGLPLTQFLAVTPYSVGGRDVLPLPQRPLAGLRTVTPDYFSTMGIPLISGRTFTADDREQGNPVVVLNQTFARRLFPNVGPVGQTILTGQDANVKNEIVGIVADVKSASLTATPSDELYFPLAQRARNVANVVVRAKGDPAAMEQVLRTTVAGVDSNQPIAIFQTMDQIMRQGLGLQHLIAWMTGIFAAIALVLATIGLYSVLAYSVMQRTSEIAIRMALGAQRSSVIGMVMGHGLRLVAFGSLAGTVGAVVAASMMRSLLFGVEPLQLEIFAGVLALFGSVGAVACWLPSLRASRINPLEALRTE